MITFAQGDPSPDMGRLSILVIFLCLFAILLGEKASGVYLNGTKAFDFGLCSKYCQVNDGLFSTPNADWITPLNMTVVNLGVTKVEYTVEITTYEYTSDKKLQASSDMKTQIDAKSTGDVAVSSSSELPVKMQCETDDIQFVLKIHILLEQDGQADEFVLYWPVFCNKAHHSASVPYFSVLEDFLPPVAIITVNIDYPLMEIAVDLAVVANSSQAPLLQVGSIPGPLTASLDWSKEATVESLTLRPWTRYVYRCGPSTGTFHIVIPGNETLGRTQSVQTRVVTIVDRVIPTLLVFTGLTIVVIVSLIIFCGISMSGFHLLHVLEPPALTTMLSQIDSLPSTPFDSDRDSDPEYPE